MSTRSLENIFLSLQSLLNKKKQLEQSDDQIAQAVKCLCGRNEYQAFFPEKIEDSICEDDIQCLDKNEPIYLQKSAAGFRFAVCPSCNPKLHCEFCEGTGHRTLTRYSISTSEEGQELEHSIHDINPNSCACTHTEKIVTLLNDAQIPAKYMSVTFDSFQLDHLNMQHREKLQNNLQKMLQFCSKQVKTEHFMILYGPVGSGKTLLACSALKMLIINSKLTGRFIDFQNLLSKLKLEYEQKKSGEKLMQELRDVDVLVIDEFGKGRSENEWQLEKLDDLVNSRYNSEKITIITTNYLLDKQRYDNKEIPRSQHKEVKDFWNPLGKSEPTLGQIPVNESFWTQSLLERVGARIYDRLIEVSDFIDFIGIPSYRRRSAERFLEVYALQKPK